MSPYTLERIPEVGIELYRDFSHSMIAKHAILSAKVNGLLFIYGGALLFCEPSKKSSDTIIIGALVML